MNKIEWETKLRVFEKKIKEDGENGELWLNYADFLKEECVRPFETLKALKTAQKLLPSKDLRLQIGDAYINAGEDDKGISLIKKVLNQKQSAPGYCYLAEAYYKIEKYNDSIEACQKAIMLNSEYEEAYYLLGEVIRYESKEKAVANYYKAIQIDPKYQEAWGALGRELISMDNRIDEGLLCLKKALELNSEDGWSMLFYANGLWKKGELEKAEKAYKDAIQIYPDYSDMYKWYADFLKSQARFDEAEKQKEMANKINSSI